MKIRFHFIISLVLCIFLGNSIEVYGGELGHYTPAVYNVRDFFVPPDSGVYYAQYNNRYTTDTLKDRNGDDVGTLTVDPPGPGTIDISVDPDVDVFSVAPAFLWVSPWHILGARYAALATTGFASTSAQVALSLVRNGTILDQTAGSSLDAEIGGISDAYFQPLWLGWTGKHYDITAAYGFWAPTGTDGMSLEFWEHQLQAAGAWYPWEDQRMAVMVTGTYNIPMEKTDMDLTPGQRFTLNWGISQYIPLKKDLTIVAEIGVRGYDQWEVTEDSGSDVVQILNTTLDAKDQIHSVGLQAGLNFPQVEANLQFSYMWEYGAEARFQGEWFGVSFVKGF